MIDGVLLSNIQWRAGEIDSCTVHLIDDEGYEVEKEVKDFKNSNYKDLAITCELTSKLEDVKTDGETISFKIGDYRFVDAKIIEGEENSRIGKCTLKYKGKEEEIDLRTDPRFKQLRIAVNIAIDEQRIVPLVQSQLLKKKNGKYALEADVVQAEEMKEVRDPKTKKIISGGVCKATELQSVAHAVKEQEKFKDNPFKSTIIDDKNPNDTHTISDFKTTYEGAADFDIDKHEPKFVPRTLLGWGMDWIEPGLQGVYRKHFNTRTDEFVANMRAGKYKTVEDMTEQRWRWYMEDYLGCILSLDESISTLMEYLDKSGLSENTLVVYVGDQSFYLGEHGLYDKRWIFEESMRMPLIMRWKGTIPAGVRSQAMVQNIDYAPTLLEVAGADTPENTRTMEGVSLTPLFKTGEAPQFADRPLYYAFYEQPGEHNAPRHDGIRTQRYTFARIWTPTGEERKSGVRKPENEWLLIDNEKDPQQMRNVAQDPAYATVMQELMEKYNAVRSQYRVPADCPGSGPRIPDFLPSWGTGENDRIKK